MGGDGQIIGLFADIWVFVFVTFSWENGMGAMNTDIIKIDSTHGIPLLPQDARSALNGIRSETFSLTTP
jgi:hypothetical protein